MLVTPGGQFQCVLLAGGEVLDRVHGQVRAVAQHHRIHQGVVAVHQSNVVAVGDGVRGQRLAELKPEAGKIHDLKPRAVGNTAQQGKGVGGDLVGGTFFPGPGIKRQGAGRRGAFFQGQAVLVDLVVAARREIVRRRQDQAAPIRAQAGGDIHQVIVGIAYRYRMLRGRVGNGG